jgi:hypothetical protein
MPADIPSPSLDLGPAITQALDDIIIEMDDLGLSEDEACDLFSVFLKAMATNLSPNKRVPEIVVNFLESLSDALETED